MSQADSSTSVSIPGRLVITHRRKNDSSCQYWLAIMADLVIIGDLEHVYT